MGVSTYLYSDNFHFGLAEAGMPVVYGSEIQKLGKIISLGNVYLLGFTSKATAFANFDGIELQIVGVKAISEIYDRFQKAKESHDTKL